MPEAPAKSGYTFSLEPFEDSYPELSVLYFEHYTEMQTRLRGDGVDIPEFNPRIEQYVASSRRGDLLTWVARFEGEAVGYVNIYLTNDMHNGQLIAHEDALFMTKEHRRGAGVRMARMAINDLKLRNVKRFMITPVTDLGLDVIWKRLGFKPIATVMVHML